MHVRFNEVIDVIAEKQRLVVEINFYVHSCKIKILDSGFWKLDAGYWILDAGYWMLDSSN